jgi:hypothetical protein
VKRKLNGWVINDGGFQRYLVHVGKWLLGECHQARKARAGLVVGDVVEGDCTLLERGVMRLFTAASVFFLTWEHRSG